MGRFNGRLVAPEIALRHTCLLLRRLGSLIAIASSLLVGCADMPPASFSRSAWLADFAQLKTALEAGYANLTWKASTSSDVDLPSIERNARIALDSAESDAQARQALLTFVGQMQDGHLSPLPVLAAPAAELVTEPALPDLQREDPDTRCAALGYASTAPVAFSLPFESLPGFRLLSDGSTTPFRTGIGTLPDGRKIGLLRVQLFSAKAYPAVCIEAFRLRMDSALPLDEAAFREDVSRRWFSALAERLDALAVAGASALLIDVGRNSGGNDTGDWLPRMLTDQPVRSARLLMVDGPPALAYFGAAQSEISKALDRHPAPDAETALRAGHGFFARAASAVGRQPCDLSWVWRERRPWRLDACNRLVDAGYAGGALATLPRGAFGDAALAAELSGPSTIDAYFGRWTRPVFVWVDGRSYSSAEMFAAVVQDQRVGALIGVHSGRDGCGFMVETAPLVLTNSRLRFRMPNCVRLRSDGTNEEAGIEPDLPIRNVAGESERARAARALSAIAAALPKRGR